MHIHRKFWFNFHSLVDQNWKKNHTIYGDFICWFASGSRIFRSYWGGNYLILCSYGITYNVKCVFMVVFVLLKIRFFQKYGFSMVFHYLTENTYIINYLNFGENKNDCKTEFVIWNIFLSRVACISCKAWVHSMKSAYRSQTPSHCIHFVFYIPSILCFSLDFEHTTTETML